MPRVAIFFDILLFVTVVVAAIWYAWHLPSIYSIYLSWHADGFSISPLALVSLYWLVPGIGIAVVVAAGLLIHSLALGSKGTRRIYWATLGLIVLVSFIADFGVCNRIRTMHHIAGYGAVVPEWLLRNSRRDAKVCLAPREFVSLSRSE